MTRYYYIYFLVSILIVSIITFSIASHNAILHNIEIIKGILSFCSLMTAVAVALVGFTSTSIKSLGVHGGRMLRATYSCLVLVILGILGSVVCLLSLHYCNLRIFAFVSAAACAIGTLNLVIGLALESNKG